jgi:hypothetical protein
LPCAQRQEAGVAEVGSAMRLCMETSPARLPYAGRHRKGAAAVETAEVFMQPGLENMSVSSMRGRFT